MHSRIHTPNDLLIPFAAALLLSLSSASAENWPGFRGATGMGTTTATELPLEWGGKEGKNLLW